MFFLLQVIIDLGRRPEARFLGVSGGEYLREGQVSWPLAESSYKHAPLAPCTDGAWRTRQILWEDLKDAEAAVGEFGGDNRAGELPRLLPP